MPSAFEQAVRAGDHPRVHIRSAFRLTETRCGLQETAPFTVFTKTEEAATCPYCTRPEAKRPRR